MLSFQATRPQLHDSTAIKAGQLGAIDRTGISNTNAFQRASTAGCSLLWPGDSDLLAPLAQAGQLTDHLERSRQLAGRTRASLDRQEALLTATCLAGKYLTAYKHWSQDGFDGHVPSSPSTAHASAMHRLCQVHWPPSKPGS